MRPRFLASFRSVGLRPHSLPLILAALASLPAFAQEGAVGNVGLRSVDVPTANLAALESALDRAISVHAPSARGKTATLASLANDADVAAKRAEARRAADAGANAMRQLALEKSQQEFDRAEVLFRVAHGDRLEPVEVARLYTTRAKVAQTLRNAAQMKEELRLAAPLHATKSLDPNTFPPDTVALFEKVVAELSAQPLAPPGAISLQDIAKRTGLAWVVAGEVRSLGGSNGHRVALAVVDSQGVSKTIELTANPFDPNESFDAAVAKLFTEAGILRPSVIATVATPDPLFAMTPVVTATPLAVATAKPVPSNALPRPTPTPRPPYGQPWYKKWYVVAGGAALVVGAGAIAASSASGSRSSSTKPGEEGITLVIED